jgi:tripartite-type tricarboxylate transporter receptor subunit TctC
VKRLAAVLLLLALNAFGQSDFPSKPIRVLVPTTAGGVPDVLARSVGQRM